MDSGDFFVVIMTSLIILVGLISIESIAEESEFGSIIYTILCIIYTILCIVGITFVLFS